MSKSNRTPLEVFLRKRAKELKSDWEDVPMWIIHEANKFFEQDKPTPREQMIEKAEMFLSYDSEVTIAQMIEAIANHEDENDLIDNVEGVLVWEKVEWSFTCEQFLEQIGFNSDFYKTK